MLLSKFAPAQSRLLTFVVATCFLLSVSSSSQPHFVHASDVPAAPGIDALSQPVLHAPPDAFAQLQGDNDHSNGDEGYAPEFDYFERSLLGRQEPQKPQVDELKNNEKKNMEINPGATAYFVFKRGQRAKRSDNAVLEALEAQQTENASDNPGGEDVAADWGEPKVDDNDVGDKLRTRQADNRVWISANTCRQPTANGTAKPKSYPQLVMFVSTSPKNQKPGPDSLDGLATPPSGVLFENGFASFDLQADTDIYVGISAPNLDKDLVGSWSFEIAASVDGSYYSYNASNPFLFMVDNDSESALFITYNLSDLGTNDTNKWRDYNPFRMYAFSTGDETPITGMEHSLCALKDRKNQTNVTVAMSITTKFGGELPKSQFHIQGLEAGKKYNGFLTAEGGKDALQLPGNGTIRGGGMVFQQFEFTTKTDDSCQVIFDLDFCDSVAYAVPSNSGYKTKDLELKSLYDDQAKEYYKNFTNSLAQVACDTTGEAQYSLARTCKDCERDYKNWLCSVLIPRCEDWSAPGDWLQARNVNARFPDGSLTFDGNITEEMNSTIRNRLGYNSTRNPGIDKVTPDGPYKEMKPCEDLCFDIVRSCPAALGFACPNNPARGLTYGKRDPTEMELKCNFPGAVVKLNVQGASSVLGAPIWVATVIAVLAAASFGI